MSYTASMIARAEQALIEGRKEDAYSIVKLIVDTEPTNAHAWHVLSNATDDPQEAAIARARELQARPLMQTQPPPRIVTYEPQSTRSYSNRQSKKTLSGGIVIVGAILIGIGSMQPWVKVASGTIEPMFENFATTALITAAILFLMGIWVLISGSYFARTLSFLAIVCGGSVAGITLFITLRSTEFRLAPGLIIVLLGVFVTFVGICIRINRR